MSDNKVVDKLINLICQIHDISFEEIRDHKHFEDKRVPGQYAIRLFIGKDYLEYACRHAVLGKPFKPKLDIVETNFTMWPPPSIEFNEIFYYSDDKNKNKVGKV